MRGVLTSLTLSSILALGLLAAMPTRAQDQAPGPGMRSEDGSAGDGGTGQGPSIIDPDTLPGVPFPNEDAPSDPTGPDGAPLPDTPPMVVPPPDGGDDEDQVPEAFGGAPLPDDPTAAQPDPPEKADETPDERLDRLFAELKKAAGHEKAAPIAVRIQRQWARSGSATVDLLMQRAADSMTKTDNAAAIDMLDQALVLDPNYAEAWNRRATLNFTMDQWGKSLADIEQTLLHEPRHWGAMMGLGMILEQTGHKDKAFQTYMQVLDVYPALDSAQKAAARLADELTGPEI